MIKSNDSWELADIFADEGISGMKTENRGQEDMFYASGTHDPI